MISNKDARVDELLRQFEQICLDQYEAIEAGKNSTYNRLFRKMKEIDEQLRTGVRDDRAALAHLLEHPNPQVRLQAAIHALVPLPEEARRTLSTIVERYEYPQAADARGMLRALESGSYVPK